MKRNVQVMTVLASAAALAGVGYALARRSQGPSARGTRGAAAARGSARSARTTQPGSTADFATELNASDAERVSSAPDALDIALSLEGVFDGESESGAAVTARPHDHVPLPTTSDDDDARAPEDLGSAWLTQATEAERSISVAETIPDVEQVMEASDELGAGRDEDGDGVDDDETTAEYVRRHRISMAGLTESVEKKDF